MLLGIDIGNTTIYFGLIENDEIIISFRISTKKDSLSDEYVIFIKKVLEENINLEKIDSAILSSVVPEITTEIEDAIYKILNIKPLVLKRDISSPLKVKEECLRDLGADLIADSVGAISKYGTPLIIFDMGTATTCSVIDKNGEFTGGLICPGLKTSMNALINNASQLFSFELGNPTRVVNINTSECINSGIIFGHSEMINGLVKKVEEETNEKYKVVLTGGNSDYVAKFVNKEIVHDKNIIFYGLNEIYKGNLEKNEN